MICIAAFIILAVVGIFVAFISIFKRDFGRAYLRTLKKASSCVGKKVRLQKCETNFKDDVKIAILRPLVLKRPELIKPLSIVIEVVSVIIVLVVVWAILTAIKSLFALWVFGSCNVSKPSSCALGAESCSIDAEEPKNIIEATGRWFAEWGEIIITIPDRLHDWSAKDYLPSSYLLVGDESKEKPYALDIFDPGCSACMQSYRNQKSSGFFDQYNTILMVYPIQLPNGSYKFKNSDTIARYVHAATISGSNNAAIKIIDRIYTEKNPEGITYQSVFTDELSEDEAKKLLQTWLKEFGLSDTKISGVASLAYSEQVNSQLQQVSNIVINKLHIKGIPTLIYDNKLHTGVYEVQ